jgi:hypothetical protein
MKNLAKLVSASDVTAALEDAIKRKLVLRKATKYSIQYKGRKFPPKEIVRLAAILGGISENKLHQYRLQGGPPTNEPLQKMGFTIIPSV